MIRWSLIILVISHSNIFDHDLKVFNLEQGWPSLQDLEIVFVIRLQLSTEAAKSCNLNIFLEIDVI